MCNSRHLTTSKRLIYCTVLCMHIVARRTGGEHNCRTTPGKVSEIQFRSARFAAVTTKPQASSVLFSSVCPVPIHQLPIQNQIRPSPKLCRNINSSFIVFFKGNPHRRTVVHCIFPRLLHWHPCCIEAFPSTPQYSNPLKMDVAELDSSCDSTSSASLNVEEEVATRVPTYIMTPGVFSLVELPAELRLEVNQ